MLVMNYSQQREQAEDHGVLQDDLNRVAIYAASYIVTWQMN